MATHSPFVISSINEGSIHIFRMDEKGVVTVDAPRPCSKGDSYLDVVEDILGIKEWYDPETEALLEEFRIVKKATLSGAWDRETELKNKAKAISERSDALRELMGGEMHQFEKLKHQAQAAA